MPVRRQPILIREADLASPKRGAPLKVGKVSVIKAEYRYCVFAARVLTGGKEFFVRQNAQGLWIEWRIDMWIESSLELPGFRAKNYQAFRRKVIKIFEEKEHENLQGIGS